MIRVSALYLHPVKGCAGIRVESAEVTARGFANDRRFMIVDADGMFVTQRERPELVRVRTALGPDALDLTAKGLPPLRLPLRHESGPRRDVRVWEHEGRAVVHAEGSAWISTVLGNPYQLVYMPDDERRPVSPTYAQPGDPLDPTSIPAGSECRLWWRCRRGPIMSGEPPSTPESRKGPAARSARAYAHSRMAVSREGPIGGRVLSVLHEQIPFDHQLLRHTLPRDRPHVAPDPQ